MASDSVQSDGDEVIGWNSAEEHGLISKGEEVNEWNKGSEDMDLIIVCDSKSADDVNKKCSQYDNEEQHCGELKEGDYIVMMVMLQWGTVPEKM